jgi:sporulation integral membrane protein YlbJ
MRLAEGGGKMTRILSNRKILEAMSGLAVLCMMTGLLLYPKEALQAARDGLTLCYNVIIPSLFPFFVLSTLLVEFGLAVYFGRALEGIMRPLFRLGGVCSTAFALGIIGGYPVGAKTAISLYQKKLCTKEEAERLLGFCNNSGPAFILGVVGAGVFSSSRIGILLYLVHILASVCVGFLFRFSRSAGRQSGKPRPVTQLEVPHLSLVFTDAVKNAFFSTLNICAFVVFFTVLIKLLVLSGAFPFLTALIGELLSPIGFTQAWAERLLTGIIELTCGVWTLTGSGAMVGKLSMAAFMLGWAGFSVHCQVLSFIGSSGLSVRAYLFGKILHGGISACLILLVTRFLTFEEPVAAYLAEQVRQIAGMDFRSALIITMIVVWSGWVLFLFVSAYIIRKNSRKQEKSMVSYRYKHS